MGKSKGSQRTKGNVKPSSSGRTAELLGSNGKLGFIGFGTSKIGQHVTQDSETEVDGMFSMVMKKMLKRDTTTKLKAVQEFRDLVCEKDRDVVLSILPFWPRLYNKLSLDFDRRIREAMQEANAKLIEKIKRDIAPYLRNIAGVWLLAQCDIYAPAASLAKATFNATFPEEKQSEALMFCKEQILLYFKDNLFEQTPQTLSEPNVSAEEIENKYILVIAGTLQGLKLFLSTISTESKKSIEENIKAFVSENKFWKHAKNKNSQVRVAWYNLVSVLCYHMPSVFDKFEHKLGCTVLGCLSESDPAVASAVWEAALHYVVSFQNCWESIDIHKVVLPQLWTLLRGGGKGNASLLFPCLLPFLSKLPSEVTKDNPQFFLDFFNSIIQSLFLDNVMKSTMECNAIVTAYIECLQYVCLQNGIKGALVKNLICEQLLSLLERSFTVEGAHLPVSKFYQSLGSFLQVLEHAVTKENSSKLLEQVVEEFWEKMHTLCCDLLRSEHLVQHADLVFLAYFFHCVYEPANAVNKKKKSKVKFVEETADESEEKNTTLRISCTSTSCAKRTVVFQFTVKICRELCVILEKTFEAHYMKLLCEIVTAARCPELFQAILKEQNVPVEALKDAPLFFFKTNILNWVKQNQLNKVMVETLIDIIFVICSCVDQEVAIEMLNMCCEAEKLLLLNGLLQRGLSMVASDKLFCKWLKSKQASQAIIYLLKLVGNDLAPESSNDVVHSNLNAICSMLKAFFTCSTFDDSTINISEILSIINTTFKRYLSLYKTSKLNTDILHFMCNICEHVLEKAKACWRLPVIADLLMAFFNCSIIQEPVFDENLKATVLTLWLDSLKYLPHWYVDFDQKKGFIFEAATKLHELVMTPSSSDMSVPFIEVIFLLFGEMEKVLRSKSFIPDFASKYLLRNFIEKIFPAEEEWAKLKSGLKLNLLPAYLEKKLFYPFPKDFMISAPSQSIPAYILVAQVVSAIIVKIFDHKNDARMVNMSIFHEYLTTQFPHLAWSFSYSESCGYLKEEGKPQHVCASKLQKNCFKIFALFPREVVLNFLNELYFKCRILNNFEWEIPFQNTLEIVQTFYPHDVPDQLNEFLMLEDECEIGQYLVRQIIVHHVPTELKVSLVTRLLELLSTNDNKEGKHETLCPICPKESEMDCALKIKKNLGIFSELCCCLQDRGILEAPQHQALVKEVLSSVFRYRTTDFRTEVELCQSTLVMAVLGCIIQNVPDAVSPVWADVFKYILAALEQCLKTQETVCTNALDLIFAHRTCSVVCKMLPTFAEESERAAFSNQQKRDFELISEKLLVLFYGLADTCDQKKPLSKAVESLLTTVSQAIEFLPSEALLAAVLQSIDVISDDKPLDHKAITEGQIEFPLQNYLRFLTSSFRPLQLGSHTILMKSMSLLPSLLVTEDEKSESDDGSDINKRLLPLIELLEYTSQILESMLSEVEIGECCLVLPNTDSYTYTLAYLFAWTEFLEFLAASSIQERSAYVEYLSKANLFRSLLSNLFRLMPEKPASCSIPLLRNNNDKENMSHQDILKIIFAEPPVISLLDPAAVEDIQYVACNTYYNTLRKLPAVVRMWWNNLDKCSSEAVNKYTSKNISSLLALKEIQAVHDSDMQFPNMTIRARYGTREVIATYTVDGSTIELYVQLPVNYPLGAIVISDSGNVKISKPEWRHWLMQLTAFLTYQNGSMLDGLLLWKKNLDKKFEGIEECMICFYILHSTTAKLPQRSCRTCRKKFHTDCIYKWFISSNNSTCPLCRCYF